MKLVDLNKDVFVEICPPNPLALKKVRVAKTALESVIISVPKLKVHKLACARILFLLCVFRKVFSMCDMWLFSVAEVEDYQACNLCEMNSSALNFAFKF